MLVTAVMQRKVQLTPRTPILSNTVTSLWFITEP
nr:MAG TPA: hypothetical protein [Caudoviricetes sp.]